MEQLLDKVKAVHRLAQANLYQPEKVNGEAREGDTASDLVLQCLKEDREVPAEIVERIEPGKACPPAALEQTI